MLRMRIGAGALALAVMGCGFSSAWATSTTVSASRTSSLNMSGSDTLSITSTGVFTTSGTAVTVNGASTSALTITNLGTLKSTGNRAIRINDSTTTNAHSLTIVNGSSTNSTALIESDGDDAIQSSSALNGGTIEIDNYGTIYSKANRAINLTAATGGTVIINNYATGLIEAVGTKDVIRPASGSTISNYGTIKSTDEGTQDNRGDAIDFQSNTTDTVYGTVYNYTGGVIEGAKHGITGNIGSSAAYYIYNDTGASITGLNGSGINLDIPDDIAAMDDADKQTAVAALKTVEVVNYGTITGEAHDTTGTDTDGDGIDIDGIADIENYGTVQALGSIGNKDGDATDPNISDGLAIGGGTVNNYAGATITSVGRGIQVDDSEGGAAFAATNIYNEGTIEGDVLAINIVGDLADTLTNKGSIIGDVYMGGGDDTVSLYTGETMDGTLDGGDGTGDTLKLESDSGASAAGSLSDIVNFEKLIVDGGTWSLTDDQSYSGGTNVADGATLNADATLTSAVTGDAGGTLAGTGTVSSIDAYGTVAPGDSGLGTLSTTGNVTFESGSTYAVEVNDTPEADLLSVGGTATLSGGSVDVTALSGTWSNYNKVAILTADGGLVSTFTGVTDDAAFLNSSLDYEGNTVYLILYRNDVAFTDITDTENQYNVAAAVDAGGSSSNLYSYLIADSASQAQSDLDSLSGETYASNAGTLADQAALVADTILSRFGDQLGAHHNAASPPAYGDDTRPGANAANNAIADAPVYAAWAKGFGQSLSASGDGNAAGVSGGIAGGLLGMDATTSAGRVGIAAGYAAASSDVADRASTSDIKTGILAAYAGTEVGAVKLRGGASYGWSKVDTSRTTTVGSLTEHPTASYDADVGNVFLEAAQPYALPGVDLEPFVGLAYTAVSQGAFTEQNAPVTGLSSDAQSFDGLYSTLGLRVASSVVAGDVVWRNHAMLGWRHAYGDLTPERALTFQETGASFLVDGTPIAGDSAVVEAGVDIASGATTVGVAYSGALSGDASSHAVRVSGALAF